MTPTSPNRRPDPSVRPCVFVDDADAAIAFEVEVFDGTERRGRLRTAAGAVVHAELLSGDSLLLIAHADAEPGTTVPGPPDAVALAVQHVDVDDVDAVIDRAAQAGATVIRPARDEFYGDRLGAFTDPSGHRWHVASHVEDVPPEELLRRVAARMHPDG